LTDYIHLREKTMSARELMAVAAELLAAGVPAAKLVINDRIDVALAAGACGVQLAWHSLPPAAARTAAPRLRLGVSVHSSAEAAEAGRQGADYCMYGHVFPSVCKPGQTERGLQQLGEAVRSSLIPLIAVGGIEPGNAAVILEQGAAGIAVMSGIGSATDPAAAAAAYRQAVDKASSMETLNSVQAASKGVKGHESDH
jgi:thiazole tautomerase (transcriptional regulator TenI)